MCIIGVKKIKSYIILDFIATVIEDLHRVLVFGEVEKVAPEGFDTSLEVIDEGRAVVCDVTVCDFS